MKLKKLIQERQSISAKISIEFQTLSDSLNTFIEPLETIFDVEVIDIDDNTVEVKVYFDDDLKDENQYLLFKTVNSGHSYNLYFHVDENKSLTNFEKFYEDIGKVHSFLKFISNN